ncbi:MAG: hypothetical protein V7K90_04580 [Nostoc sp.]|uniref:hypothetical protein n=1 Tax=Nostoc sp. TaxID=1180 RepID=UPI002FF67D92
MFVKKFARSQSNIIPTVYDLVYTRISSSEKILPQWDLLQIMEWLLASLMNAGYFGRWHLIWDLGNQDWKQVVLMGLLKDEPVFLYRCGDRPSRVVAGD